MAIYYGDVYTINNCDCISLSFFVVVAATALPLMLIWCLYSSQLSDMSNFDAKGSMFSVLFVWNYYLMHKMTLYLCECPHNLKWN